LAVAQAMTRQTIEMTCPYDGTKFSFNEQASGSTFDKGRDFMPMGAIEMPWPLAVCPTNGFVFIKRQYEPDELEGVRPIIFSAEFQALKDETPYYRAAWLLERQGAPRATVTNYLLQATWEVGQKELFERMKAMLPSLGGRVEEKFLELMAEGTLSECYSRYATELLARLPAEIESATKPQSTDFRLLTGELLRRLGRFEEAEIHFRAVAGDVDVDSAAARYIDLQNQLIVKRDRGLHRISEMAKPSRP
jgi:hypothetical protein